MHRSKIFCVRSAQGHNPNPRATPACQLSPIADKPLRMLGLGIIQLHSTFGRSGQIRSQRSCVKCVTHGWQHLELPGERSELPIPWGFDQTRLVTQTGGLAITVVQISDHVRYSAALGGSAEVTRTLHGRCN